VHCDCCEGERIVEKRRECLLMTLLMNKNDAGVRRGAQVSRKLCDNVCEEVCTVFYHHTMLQNNNLQIEKNEFVSVTSFVADAKREPSLGTSLLGYIQSTIDALGYWLYLRIEFLFYPVKIESVFISQKVNS